MVLWSQSSLYLSANKVEDSILSLKNKICIILIVFDACLATTFFFKQSILSIDSLYTGISVSGSQLLKNLEGMKTQKCFKGLSEIESNFFFKGMEEKAQLIFTCVITSPLHRPTQSTKVEEFQTANWEEMPRRWCHARLRMEKGNG